MSTEFYLLLSSAIGISLLHTASGPDHYLPFIALAKSRGWSIGRTIFWVVLSGCGHVWSSVLLALLTAAIDWSFTFVEWFEGIRGSLAGWALLVAGLLYALWGFLRLNSERRHRHFDIYNDGSMYVYKHTHGESVLPKERHRVTPWVLFLVFVLGPCEPMIPLLFLPAAKSSWQTMLVLVFVYTFFTVLTMICLVLAGYYGLGLFPTQKTGRYIHLISGLTLSICGAGMLFMGW